MATSNAVGQVEVRVVPDGSQFGPQLQAILDQAAGKASAAGTAIGQSISQNVGPQVQAVGRTMMDMNMQFDTAARKALAFTGAVMGTKAVVEGFVGKLAGLFDQLAQAQAGFTAIAGAQKGNALLEDIRQFAKESPFVTQQLVNYSQQLLGVGMAANKIVPLLKDTGNVIASVGGDTNNLGRVLYAMTQIQTIGRLTGQDAMQLQASLIPITKMLSSYLGKTTQEVKKLQEQGRISAEEVFGAIQAAGAKVPTAMDNAVRNIAGARSVLSDTITILMQDAPALKTIYEDIVEGIQKVAAVLSSDEVSGAIARAFEAVGKTYEAIKPAIDAFIEGVGENSLSTLKMFTEALSFFSEVVNSIPQPVLELFAKTLAAIAVLRAPMMLIRYVQQFQEMSKIFSAQSFTVAIKKTVDNIVAAEDPTKRLARENQILANSYMSVAQSAEAAAGGIRGAAGGAPSVGAAPAGGIGSRIRGFAARPGVQMLASGVGLVAGQAISSAAPDSQLASMAGGALSGASFGMMFGGPWGAAAGAAIGGMTSFFSAQKAAADKHRKEMSDLGKETAEGYIESLDKQFGMGVGYKKLAAMDTKIGELEADLATRRSSILATQSSLSGSAIARGVQGYSQQPLSASQYRAIGAMGRVAAETYVSTSPEAYGTDDQILQLQAQIDYINSQFAPVRSDLISKIGTTVSQLTPEQQQAFARNSGLVSQVGGMGVGGQGYAMAADIGIEEMRRGFAEYGLTIEQAANATAEEITRIIQTLESSLSDVEKEAAKSAASFVGFYEEGSRDAEAMWGNQSKVLGYQIKSINELKSATDTVTKAYMNQGDEAAQLGAQQAILNAKQTTYALEYAKARDKLRKQGMLDSEAAIRAEEIAMKAAERTQRELTVLSTKSLPDMAKAYGYSNEELTKLLGLQGKIDKDMKITVTVAIDDAMKKLNELNEAIGVIGRNLYALYRTGGTGSFAMSFKKLESVGVEQAQTQKYLEDLIDRQTGAPAKSGGGGGQSFSDKVKSAAQMLENSIKSAMETVKGAAEAWKSTIKDRVQYEAAVSTGRAMRNVQRQSADITALTTGIAQLKARGLSEEALKALDINAITDVRQVKRLMSASPEELKRLSSAVAQRDKLASTLASDRQREENRKTITQAILEAAKILGYKFTDTQAKAISAQFNITTETDAKKMLDQILSLLSGGKITSSMTSV